MTVDRMLESLHHGFPKLAAALGKVTFHNLAVDYLDAFPSAGPSLGDLGRRLPAFLGEHPGTRSRPWISELAALESARLDVTSRPHERVLTMDDIAGHSADGFAALRLQAVAAHSLVSVTHRIEDVWLSVDAGESIDAGGYNVLSGEALLVWRKPDLLVCHRRTVPGEFIVLALLKRGVSMAELCDVLGQRRPPATAAECALRFLTAWTTTGLLKRHART